MNPHFARRVLHTAHLTIAMLDLKQGAVVPLHHHINEQVSLVQTGRLLFRFPDREVIIGPGESVTIPPNLPHSVEVLEDSTVTDLFAPRREDWLTGNDAYLRK
jgi:quercetin dioxygenase-like cupin family protein